MKISIWTGAAHESWGPLSINSGGIGGSETAALHMAFNLARLGHQVTMFGQHEEREGTWGDGFIGGRTFGADDAEVEFVHFTKAMVNPKLLACDVFISSRDKRALRLKPDCKLSVLWVHDVHVGDDWENELLGWDKILCLTKWHKNYFTGVYPHLDQNKVAVTSNAIDTDLFDLTMAWPKLIAIKRPMFVYSSSPDRGLDILLDLWPQIYEWTAKILKDSPCAALSNASQRPSLHIYYGFENWRKLNEAANNKAGLAQIDYLRTRIESSADLNVFYHGRVGQAELAQAHMRSIVWAYPTAFAETSCITAMEAQAAGSVCVTSNLAALPETVRFGHLVNLEPTNRTKRYKEIFLDRVIYALKTWANQNDWHESKAPTEAVCGRMAAKSWRTVAAEWTVDFEESLAEKAKAP